MSPFHISLTGLDTGSSEDEAYAVFAVSVVDRVPEVLPCPQIGASELLIWWFWLDRGGDGMGNELSNANISRTSLARTKAGVPE